MRHKSERILIVCLQRLGDVLLATPLAGSLKAYWPTAKIHWLVYDDTAELLSKNPAADYIYRLPRQSNFFQVVSIAFRLCQKYDYSFSTQSGDKPSLLARIAGRNAYTFQSCASGGLFRDKLFTNVVTPRRREHQVDRILSLLDLLTIPKITRVLTPTKSQRDRFSEILKKPYIVLHPGAAFRYKLWTAKGWNALAEALSREGFNICITGSDNVAETSYLDELFSGLQVIRLDGQLSWQELSAVLANAVLYIGVDTSVTHLASALGVPGIALFGPTDPLLWHPGGSSDTSSIVVIQNSQPCVPCQQEGCDRHVSSLSDCLSTLAPDKVLHLLRPMIQSCTGAKKASPDYVT